MPPAIEIIAIACIIWYSFVVLVCAIGVVQIFRHYSSPPEQARSVTLPQDDIPHVTVIRPCKGIEPYLYECLASTCQQDYPKDKLTIHLCIATRQDAAFDTLNKIKHDHPTHDIRIFIEEDDNAAVKLGPNPKIRNMSRAYREAKSDFVWILDCNIWVGRGVCGRMVDKIMGFGGQPYKFVHHLPVAVDQPAQDAFRQYTEHDKISSDCYGGRLDEAFLSSAHAKMYVAINTVAVAPCICGKSSMFRRSHLDALTSHGTDSRSGIDYFSDNICEDHLIGDLLWREPVPVALDEGKKWGNHGLVYGDVALQPVSGMSVSNYVARRVRWLRVRKFTVPLATLVEPGTESLMCSLIGAYGLTKWSDSAAIVGESWLAMALVWLFSVVGWVMVDRGVYVLLQANRSVERHETGQVVPPFARRSEKGVQPHRSFYIWLMAWIGREGLAFPIWVWAIWGGASVIWRDKKLWVGFDMKVHEYEDETTPLLVDGEVVSIRSSSKVRQD